MPLTEVESKIVKEVLRRYLAQKEPTPKRPLLTQFRDPEALDRLVKSNVLESHNQLSYLPKALAFHNCGDADVLLFAKNSVELIAHVFQNLFDAEPEKTHFTAAEIEAHARKMYGEVKPEAMSLGLYLAREFHRIACGYSMNPQQTECTSVTINEYIVTLKNIDNLWDDHIRQSSVGLERPEEQAALIPSPERNILLTALRLFCGDLEFEDLLVRAYNITAPKLNLGAFELYVGWLLGVFGLSTVVLGKYEHIVAPETRVRRASVDILAANQDKKLLLLVACTIGPPKPEDFGNLRNAREILLREAFYGTEVRVTPVLFTAAMGCPPCDRTESSFDYVPIVDADKMKELLGSLREGQEARFFEFLDNPAPVTLPYFFPH